MNPEQWKRIDELFHAALEREPSAREAFLAQECEGNDSLRKELEGLVACHENESSFFENPPSDLAAELLSKQNPQDRTISHYRIVKKIGSGGMGEVYLAEDTRLNRKVALKLLPLEFTKDKDRIRRFEQEARTVSALNHPNILTIHDIGMQDSSSFIASEYIDGETLRHRISTSKMTLKETLRIVIQIAEALDAAHQAGIIHRDIKPENIMLRKDGYVKVLDFGLAKLTESAPKSEISELETLHKTQTGVVIGTVRYMSPEQARGLKLDTRTDIFSLGVVLYELATGRAPFYGPTSQDSLVAILEKNPPVLSTYGEFPDEFQWIISKALAKDTDERYQTVKELLTDLKRVRKQLEISEELKRSGPSARSVKTFAFATKSKKIAAVIFCSLILFISIFYGQKYFKRFQPDQSAGAINSIRSRPSIAVFGFKNLSGSSEAAWISSALSEMLSTELAVGEKLLVISGEEVSRSKKELSLDQTDSFSPATLAQIHNNLPADYLILGSYYVPPGQKQIRLDLHVQKTQDGKTAARFTETRSELDLLSLVLATGSRLRQSFGIVPLNAQQINSARSSLSSNPEAIRFYSEGIARMRELDRRGARDLFSKAVKADSKFPLAFSALSEAWLELGYSKNAREAAKTALELSGELSREERLLVEGHYYQAHNDWNSAIRSYQSLFTFFPDNLEYGLLLIDAQSSAKMVADTRETLKLLRNLPSPLNQDPRIDLADLQNLEFYDAGRNLKLAHTAAEKARLRGSDLLEARALTSQGLAFNALNRKTEAISVYERAKQIYKTHDRKADALVVENYLAWALRDLGDREGALALEENLLQKYRELGEDYNLAITYYRIGDIQWHSGKTESALKSYNAARQILERLGNSDVLGYTIEKIASLYSSTGELAKSEKNYREAIKFLRDSNSTYYLQSALRKFADLKEGMGDKDQARQLYIQALEHNRNLKDRTGIAVCLVDLASLSNSKEDLGTAREYLEQILKEFRSEKSLNGQVFALNKLEEVYQLQYDVSNTAKAIQEKLQIVRKSHNPWQLAIELQSSASTLEELGLLKDAEILSNEMITNHSVPEIRVGGLFNLIYIQWDKGDIGKFKTTLERLKEELSTADTSGRQNTILAMDARHHFESGDLMQAQKLWEECLKRGTESRYRQWNFRTTLDLAMLAAVQAQYQQAEQLFQQALKMTKEESFESSINYYHEKLGNYYYQRGKFNEAENEWNTQVDYYRKSKSPWEEKLFLSKVAHSKIMQNDFAVAADILKDIDENDPQIRERFWYVTEIRHAKASLLSAQKKYSEAIQILNGVIKKAANEGLIHPLLETNLILAEVEIQSGKKAEGISRLESLEKEARNQGFINIAEKALRLKKSL